MVDNLTSTSEKLDELNKSLEEYITKMDAEEMENYMFLSFKETEYLIKNLSTRKASDLNSFMDKFY